MHSLRKKNLVLFFTTGVSMELWDKAGNLYHEIALYRILARHFRNIYFLSYGNSDEKRYQDLLPRNVVILPNRWSIPSLLYSLLIPFIYGRYIRKAEYYKTDQMSGAWTAALSALLYKGKLIVRCGYEWYLFLQRRRAPFVRRVTIFFIEKILYCSAEKIILTSYEDKIFVKNTFYSKEEKICVIPNYVDTQVFRSLDMPKDQNRILFVGRLTEQKNLFNLIEAVASLRLKLTIIGTGSLERRLKEFANRMGASIDFLGPIPNNLLPEEMNRSSLFVLPSLYEGCPKVLLEAMACEMPVIGTNVPGISEVIKHGENGYLCDTDYLSIKKAIQHVFQDKALQKKISANARNTINERFSIDALVLRELKLYR